MEKMDALIEKIAKRELRSIDAIEEIKDHEARTEMNIPGQEIKEKRKPCSNKGRVSMAYAGNSSLQEIIKEKLEHYLADKVREKLRDTTRRIENHVNFLDLGIDSGSLLELSRLIEEEAGIELYPTLFFEYQNINELAAYFAEEFGEPFGLLLHVDPGQLPVKPSRSNDPEHANLGLPFHKSSPVNTITEQHSDSKSMAVIGMAGMFAGSRNLEQFWHHLKEGADLITEIPESRFDYRPWFDKGRAGKGTIYCKWGSFLESVDMFDAEFFNISRREAEMMDPQLRLLLQNLYATAEDAGYAQTIRGTNTGMYVGTMYADYFQEVERRNIPMDPYLGTGNAATMLANRPSFYFDLKGPSLSLNTACSSSLVALHIACKALQEKECEMAFVSGVNLVLSAGHYQVTSALGMLSETGRCHTFDARADGYVPGEAISSVLLKPLAQAIKDGDRIHAIIKGSAINHGGYTPSVTAPSMKQERDVIVRSWKNAAIDPSSITYIEAHGTGTKLGDPVEVDALNSAFKSGTTDENFCAIGSAKAHIGHTEGAAGVTGVIKTILAMQHQEIPAMPKLEKLNPLINLEKSALFINTESIPWERKNNTPRRAGVSSFGFGGAYAHVVIEEYPTRPLKKTATDATPHIAVFSAKTKESLDTYLKECIAYLAEHTKNNEISIQDIVYTLQIGKPSFNERLAVVVRDVKELITTLTNYIEGNESVPAIFRGSAKDANEITRIISSKTSGEEFLRSMFAHQEYESIAQLWVKGVTIAWSHYTERARIISLPSYQFLGESFWFPEHHTGQEAGLPGNMKSVAQQPGKAQKKIFEIGWMKSDEAINERDLSGTVLILANEHTMPLAESLFRNVETIRPVIVRDTVNTYYSLKQHYHIDFNNEEHGTRVAHDILQASGKISACIDLSDLAVDQPQQGIARISLLQTLIKKADTAPLFILHLTEKLQPFKGKTSTISGAFIAGLVAMLGAEYGKVRARHIDIDVRDAGLIQKIIFNELRLNDLYGEICYRDNTRYVPVLEEVIVPTHHNLHALDKRKAIVITGGTRGIGAEVARYFAAEAYTHIVLMGRQELPPREDWERVLAAEEEKETIEKIAFIRELERKGVRVDIFTGSLLEEEKLAGFFEEIRQTSHGIAGVVHCAGMVDLHSPAFINKTIENVAKVIEPKVDALQVLHRLFERDYLEFFLMFSSISSCVPLLAVGVSDYAQANAYMNYFASYQHGQGNTYYKSLVWPNWVETGMGASKSPYYDTFGFSRLKTHQGIALLHDAISMKDKHVLLPAYIDPETFDQGPLFKVRVEEDKTNRREQTPDKKERSIPLEKRETLGEKPQQEDRDEVKEWLKNIIAEKLKLSQDKLEDTIEFGDYGVDSILLAEIGISIEQKIGEPVDPSIILEYPTIEKLAGYLLEHYSGMFQEDVKEKEIVPDSPDVTTDEGTAEVTGLVVEDVPVTPTLEKDLSDNIYKEPFRDEKIAVIGMACHFPGADSIDQYWYNIRNSIGSIREIPSSRWNINEYYSPEIIPGRSVSKWGGFIDDIEYFDAKYFKIDEETAPFLDPLVRQFLETSAQAIHHAGYKKEELWNKKVGVFAGSRVGNYSQRVDVPQKSSIVGIGQNFIAAHVSHFFNLKGPSLIVDTACSSSLVSLQLASQSLLQGEADIALAGGVDILLDEATYLILSEARALSPDGKCHTFDEKANGFVPGEGCGVVVLKRLEKAIRDGDQIYAVIDSIASNNDGNTMGITTPNPEAQKGVIEEALRRGRIQPDTISLIEAHGTGTMIGDPIELKALTEIFRQVTDDTQFCAVGSVKTNIGHLLSAAGIASFIKIVLSLYHKEIPPTLHCVDPNPRFQFETSPFYPSMSLQSWEPRQQIRRAGISAFGFGGTNAHVVVSEFNSQDYAAYSPVRQSLPPVLFNKKYYWIEKKRNRNDVFNKRDVAPGLEQVSAKNTTAETILEIIDESDIIYN